MPPTFLVAGATGNTGHAVVETLSKLLNASSVFSGHRILALTRSANGSVAQRLAQLPGVEVAEQNWVEITPDWLRQQNVVRAFIASHNQPSQFAEESTFHLALLNAGVKYVVRISTTAANVRPDFLSYYPRSHWAIEALLATPEFAGLQWTSLQPNVFTQFTLGPAVALVKQHRETGEQGTLRLMLSEDAPVGVVDPYEVGVLAATLLAEEDPTRHAGAKYVINGPEDVTGAQVIKMIEEKIGGPVKDFRFKDMSFIEQAAAQAQESRNLILSIRHAPETAWNGECSASTTSKEVLDLAPPRNGPLQIFEALLESKE